MANNGTQRSPLAGIGKVYRFTLRQTVAAKGWLLSTIILGLLLLVGLPLLLFGLSSIGKDKATKEDDKEKDIRLVCVVDETEGEADYSALNQGIEKPYEFRSCISMDAAISESVGARDAVILRVTKQENAYSLTVYLPQVTDISRSRASSFGSFAEQNFMAILLQKAEITPEGAALLSMPVNMTTASVNDKAEVEEKQEDSAKFIIGMLMTWKNPISRAITRCYLEIVRIMPQMVLLFLVYFGTTRVFGWNLSGELSAVIVFSFWGTAEMGDLVRGAVMSIPAHQYESAAALGLTGMQTYRYIVLPQTVRRLIPLSINLITRMIKTTSLVLMIGVVEILKVAQQIIEANRMSSPNAAFGVYLTVFLMYFIACWPISMLAKYLEKQWR